MVKIAMILMIILLNVEKAMECPSQTSNVDIHDLIKQKLMQNGGKQDLSNQKVESLLPIHHQIQQENRSVKEFIILVVVANTISTLLLIGIIQICKVGMRYTANVLHEIETLRAREENNP